MMTLRQARHRRGLTQQQLAVLTGVAQPTVANWECGHHIPHPHLKARVEATLNAAIDWHGISKGFEQQEATFIQATERFLTTKVPNAQLLRRVQRAREIIEFFSRRQKVLEGTGGK